jgi:hypothetical protein
VSAAPGDVEHRGKPRISIDVDGAIETLEVRTAITTVMEGGQDAFDLRGKKYNFASNAAETARFWKPRSVSSHPTR